MSPDDPQELLKRYEPRAIKVLKPDRPMCTARFSPDGKLLAAGSTDATVRRWDFSDDATPELPPLPGHNGWVQALDAHPDGRRLIVSATNANSNGNGRKIGKGNEYPGNWSPLHVWEMPV